MEKPVVPVDLLHCAKNIPVMRQAEMRIAAHTDNGKGDRVVRRLPETFLIPYK